MSEVPFVVLGPGAAAEHRICDLCINAVLWLTARTERSNAMVEDMLTQWCANDLYLLFIYVEYRCA